MSPSPLTASHIDECVIAADDVPTPFASAEACQATTLEKGAIRRWTFPWWLSWRNGEEKESREKAAAETADQDAISQGFHLYKQQTIKESLITV